MVKSLVVLIILAMVDLGFSYVMLLDFTTKPQHYNLNGEIIIRLKSGRKKILVLKEDYLY